MTGRIIHTPEPTALCDRASGCPDRPLPTLYRAGTIWQCDLCSRQWVLVEGAQYNEPYKAWRLLTDANRDGSDR